MNNLREDLYKILGDNLTDYVFSKLEDLIQEEKEEAVKQAKVIDFSGSIILLPEDKTIRFPENTYPTGMYLIGLNKEQMAKVIDLINTIKPIVISTEENNGKV